MHNVVPIHPRLLDKADSEDEADVAGGTIPWMESVESSLEQRPRATQETKPKPSMTKDFQYGHMVGIPIQSSCLG